MFGGTGDDIGYSIQQTADSGFIIAGNTTSINGNVSAIMVVLMPGFVKLGSINATDTLAVQWSRCLGGSLNDYAQSVQQTKPDGGYIVAGYSNSTDSDLAGDNPHGLYDCWIIKLDPTGSTIQWQKLMGGSDNDEAYSIQQTAATG